MCFSFYYYLYCDGWLLFCGGRRHCVKIIVLSYYCGKSTIHQISYDILLAVFLYRFEFVILQKTGLIAL